MAGNVWDRQDGEPSDWYARFDGYRLLGPSRTLEGAHRAVSGGKKRASGAWTCASRKWRWQERAEAWDDAQRAEHSRRAETMIEAARAENLALAKKAKAKAEEVLDAIPTGAGEHSIPDTVKLLEFAVALEGDCLAAPALADIRRRLERLQGMAGRPVLRLVPVPPRGEEG